MNTVIIELYVPILLKTYDLQIPLNMQIHTVTQLASELLKIVDQYVYGETTVLCWRDGGNILDVNLSAGEAGLENGSRLMMI